MSSDSEIEQEVMEFNSGEDDEVHFESADQEQNGSGIEEKEGDSEAGHDDKTMDGDLSEGKRYSENGYDRNTFVERRPQMKRFIGRQTAYNPGYRNVRLTPSLVVKNLPENTNTSQIKDLFPKAINIQISHDQATVTFRSANDATNAKNRLYQIGNNKLFLFYSSTRNSSHFPTTYKAPKTVKRAVVNGDIVRFEIPKIEIEELIENIVEKRIQKLVDQKIELKMTELQGKKTIDVSEKSIDVPEKSIDVPEKSIDAPEKSIDVPEKSNLKSTLIIKNLPADVTVLQIKNFFPKAVDIQIARVKGDEDTTSATLTLPTEKHVNIAKMREYQIGKNQLILCSAIDNKNPDDCKVQKEEEKKAEDNVANNSTINEEPIINGKHKSQETEDNDSPSPKKQKSSKKKSAKLDDSSKEKKIKSKIEENVETDEPKLKTNKKSNPFTHKSKTNKSPKSVNLFKKQQKNVY